MQDAGAERAVVLEPRPRPARHDLHLERDARPEGAQRHGLGVDLHDTLRAPDLLLEQVLEQVATLGSIPVRGEAFALAGDGGRDEGHRVELRVRVRQRRPGAVALVHAHVDERRFRVRAHALAPRLHRDLDLRGIELDERPHRLGSVDDHLVHALGRPCREQVGLAAARVQRIPSRARRHAIVPRLERWVEVRHNPHAPPGPVGFPAAGPQREDLRRRHVLVPLQKRILRRVDRRRRLDAPAAAGPARTLAGDDRAKAGQRVDAELGQAASYMPAYRRMSSRSLACDG